MFAKLALGILVAAVAVPPAVRANPGPGDGPKGRQVLTDKPLTVRVGTTDRLEAALAAAADRDPKFVIRLALDGVVPPENRAGSGGVRVFVNKNDATHETPTDDLHFVTAFDFSPTGGREAQGFNLDLTRTVKELRRRGELDPAKPLRITLVAVPAEGVKKLPEGFSVPIERVTVEVVDLPK
jgi:hypothetical protein